LKEWTLEARLPSTAPPPGFSYQYFLDSIKGGLSSAVYRVAHNGILTMAKDLDVVPLFHDSIQRSQVLSERKSFSMMLRLFSPAVLLADGIDWCSDESDDSRGKLRWLNMFKKSSRVSGKTSESILLEICAMARRRRCFRLAEKCLGGNSSPKFLLENARLFLELGKKEKSESVIASLLSGDDLAVDEPRVYSDTCMLVFEMARKNLISREDLQINSASLSFLPSDLWTSEYYLGKASSSNSSAHFKLASLYYDHGKELIGFTHVKTDSETRNVCCIINTL
jgi:hypothetical protein